LYSWRNALILPLVRRVDGVSGIELVSIVDNIFDFGFAQDNVGLPNYRTGSPPTVNNGSP
jgi:hypothetical protein